MLKLINHTGSTHFHMFTWQDVGILFECDVILVIMSIGRCIFKVWRAIREGGALFSKLEYVNASIDIWSVSVWAYLITNPSCHFYPIHVVLLVQASILAKLLLLYLLSSKWCDHKWWLPAFDLHLVCTTIDTLLLVQVYFTHSGFFNPMHP